MRIYGAPFSREVQLNRQLRRARPGLIRGRSEAVAPVRLRTFRSRRLSLGTDGAPGEPGPDGSARLTRGYRMWARPVPASPIANASVDKVRVDFNFFGSLGAGALIVAPPTNDIQALPRLIREPDSGVAGSAASMETQVSFVPGNLSAHDGFSIVCQFAFSTLSADQRWFVGLTEATGGTMFGDPSSATGLLGVGMDEADSSPQFMHSEDFPSSGTVKAATGLAAVAINTLYEARFYWGPGLPSAQMSFESFAGGVSSGIAAYDTAGSSDVPSAARSWILYLANGSSFGINRFAFLGFFAELHPGTVI